MEKLPRLLSSCPHYLHSLNIPANATGHRYTRSAFLSVQSLSLHPPTGLLHRRSVLLHLQFPHLPDAPRPDILSIHQPARFLHPESALFRPGSVLLHQQSFFWHLQSDAVLTESDFFRIPVVLLPPEAETLLKKYKIPSG